VTNLVPHSMEEWMRTMERRYVDLASRQSTTSALGVSTPRWRSNLAANLSATSGVLYFLGFSVTNGAPEHNPGDPAFLSYSAASGEARYTFLYSGLYYIKASIQWDGTVTGVRKGHIFNGADATPIETFEIPASSRGVMNSVETIYPFAAGSYFRIGANQDSGSTINVLSNSSNSATSPRAASNLVVCPVGAYAL
jgi:hypothetical protein